MTPYYSDTWLDVYLGDCREVLATLPAESVHMVCTSPPYFGLRDYGTATWDGGDAACGHIQSRSLKRDTNGGLPPAGVGTRGTQSSTASSVRMYRDTCGKCGAVRHDRQLGLEPTPGEYVAAMVDVFREVRRVLRDDGTLWLNLGSSYQSSGERHTGRNDTDRETPGGRGGSFRGGVRTTLGYAAGGSGPSPFPELGRVPACDTDGTGPLGCSAPDCACSGLCDGCLAARSSRSLGTRPPTPGDASHPSLTGRGTELPGSAPASPDASPLASQASMPLLSEPRPLVGCSHCGNCGACLSVLRSPSRESRECVRRSAYTSGIERLRETSEARMSGKAPSVLAWGDYTSTLKPKDMVPTPWMVAMALQADGWYLRSDIVWSKSNPMPESVTDRPTKSHEYLFLLTKSPRYYFDADAVRESYLQPENANGGAARGLADGGTPHIGQQQKHGRNWTLGAGRNIRSVWTIATQPYAGSHFATFPQALVEPCVKAGCPEGGTVLDPFAGSGTTALVANRLSRRAILIDLSADYLDQAMIRNAQTPAGLSA